MGQHRAHSRAYQRVRWAFRIGVILSLMAMALSYGWFVIYANAAGAPLWVVEGGDVIILLDRRYLEFSSVPGGATIQMTAEPGVSVTARGPGATLGIPWGIRKQIHGSVLIVPIWWITVPLVIASILLGIDDLVKTQESMLCFECGYDLTGNTSGVCPECGMPCPRDRRALGAGGEASGERDE